MKKGSNYQEKRSARWGVLCGKEEYTAGVGGAPTEEEEHQISAKMHQQGLGSTHTSRGVPKCGVRSAD